MNDEKNKPEPIQELIDKWNKMQRLSEYQHTTTEKPSVEGVINHEFSIRQIKNRILEEYQKHPELDWAELAARKIIATQQLEIERLKEQLERYEGDSIHSCHPNCKRPMCMLRQETERLKAELEEVRSAIDKALSPENIECDGSHCQGCYKDILRPYKTNQSKKQNR